MDTIPPGGLRQSAPDRPCPGASPGQRRTVRVPERAGVGEGEAVEAGDEVGRRFVRADVAMPAEGTDAHVTLLVAEYLASSRRRMRQADIDVGEAPGEGVREHDIADFLREARTRYGRYWRKSAREPGAERELAAIAIERLEKLQLAARRAGTVHPLPALARFALDQAAQRRFWILPSNDYKASLPGRIAALLDPTEPHPSPAEV